MGFEIRRNAPMPRPGSPTRPLGNLKNFLEDVKSRKLSPRGILDIGANRGDWSRLALSIFPDASVIMVEPQDEMQEHLRAVCSEHPGCRNVKSAVGRSEGTLVQTIWQDLAGSSFLPKIEASKLSSGEQRLTSVTTIDRLLSQNKDFRPDLVKLDIQGFEVEALTGGTRLFGATELFIVETSLYSFMEQQPITREIVHFMADRGYEIYDIADYIRRPYDGALGSIDLAFVKADGFLRASSSW